MKLSNALGFVSATITTGIGITLGAAALPLTIATLGIGFVSKLVTDTTKTNEYKNNMAEFSIQQANRSFKKMLIEDTDNHITPQTIGAQKRLAAEKSAASKAREWAFTMWALTNLVGQSGVAYMFDKNFKADTKPTTEKPTKAKVASPQ